MSEDRIREEPKTGVDLIAAERRRQIDEEGWTPEHDDQWRDGELARAAVCYAAPTRVYHLDAHVDGFDTVDPFPWPRGGRGAPNCDRRPYDGNLVLDNNTLPRDARLSQLVKAGALIAAEIDRLIREGGREDG